MVIRTVRDQIELLAEHIERGNPSPEFIATHAAMILDLAQFLHEEVNGLNTQTGKSIDSSSRHVI